MKRATLVMFILATLVVPATGQTIRRQDIINNAAAFQNLSWKVGSGNVQDQCYSPIWIKTHFAAGTTVTGVAYCWGGGDTVSAFKSGIGKNGKAGNRCTDVQGNKLGYRPNTYGVDCSGLVTRAWGRPEKEKFGTSDLAKYCSEISNSKLRLGDIFALAGSHTAIFSRFLTNGNPWIIEASSTDWKVAERERPWSYFNGYQRLRYKQLQDGGIAKINQGLSVQPLTVKRGKNIDVMFHLKELDGASITYDIVTVAILDLKGGFKLDLPWVNNFSVPANGEKTFLVGNSLASAKIDLPAGTYVAVVRGKIGNDWFDFQTTGSGVNGVKFTVTK